MGMQGIARVYGGGGRIVRPREVGWWWQDSGRVWGQGEQGIARVYGGGGSGLFRLEQDKDCLIMDRISNSQWSLDKEGVFAVAPLRRLVDDITLPSLDFLTSWDNAIPRRLNIFMCRLKIDKLPHRLNLSRRALVLSAESASTEEAPGSEDDDVITLHLTVDDDDFMFNR
nr:RNA-directed DNA polymerase, eukaryota [Tanacetum cinerariifolium]